MLNDPHVLSRLSESRFLDYFEHIGRGIIIFDKHFKYIWSNQIFREIMGYPEHYYQDEMPIDQFVAYDCKRGLYGTARPEIVAAELKAEIGASDTSSIEIEIPNGPIVQLDRRLAGDGSYVYECSNVTHLRSETERSAQDTAIIQQLSDGVVVANLDYRLIYFNSAFLKLFSFALKDPNAMFLPPHGMAATMEFEAFTKAMDGAIADHGRYECELHIKGQDDEEKIIHSTCLPRRDISGHHIGYIGIFRDMTKSAHDRARLERQDRVISQLNDSVVIADHNGKITDCNPATIDIFGYELDELKGKRLLETVQMYKNTGSMKLFVMNALRTGGSWNGELNLRHKDGHLVVMDCNVQPFFDEHGNRIGMIGVHRDITKRQRAEMEIKQQNQIIEHMWEAVIITDPQGCIEEYNASASRLLGLHDKRPANEACKLHLIQITDNVKKTGRHEEEYVIGDPASPDAIYMDCLAMPVIGRDGDIVRIVSVHRDVTDRIRRQKEQDERTIQKERSMRLESLGKIAGGIAHDFNNLLTPVLGYAHLARSAVEKQSPVYHDMDRVIKGMEKARNLVRQILAFGQKLDSTRSIEVFDDLITATLTLIKDSFPPSIEVLWTPGCADTRLRCNKTLIDQLFMNLCWNAVQAMQDGGTLSIKTDQKGDWAAIRSQFQLKGDDHVRLVISDTGPGIDAKTKNHIYEPFFTTKGSSKSHGLGLSVVHGVVKAHGGTILVHNIKPHGACFEIYLPATKDHNIAANQPEFSDKHQYRNNKETILIIDDEEDVRKILRRMLNEMGIKTLCAESGPRAIEIIKNNPNINLVITDYLMPEMSGEDFAKTFRLHNKITPIVLLSAIIEPRTVREYRAWGVNALLQKPVVPEDLYEMICAQLDGENKA